jgi:hypothetical protein
MDFFKSLHEQNGGPNCCRCGQPTTLATVLPRFGETPGSPKDRRRRRMGRLSWRPLLRFPPPWSGEELDNERRGRSASPPSSWAVSRNRHHMPILQYCNIRAA